MSDVSHAAYVQVDGYAPRIAHGTAPGEPITIRYADTRLSLAIAGVDPNAAIGLVACIDGLLVEHEAMAEGPLVVRGLDPGRHTVVFDSTHHSPLVFEIDLREGAPVHLDVPLPADPPGALPSDE